MAQIPSVDVARPSRCPVCGAPSVMPGRRILLQGHGLRERLRFGPEEPGGRPVVAGIKVRRYLCKRCPSVIVVAPRGLLPRLRYGAVAVALALGLWAAEVLTAAEVRKVVSPFAIVGHEARRSWRSLRRWARLPPWPFEPRAGPLRDRARELVQHLAGHASAAGPLTLLACQGALRC